MTQPIVSVLITAFNREKYIANSIESVLNSSIKNIEVIIVDNCSEDRTYEICQSYEKKDTRIRLYKNPTNIGQFPNRDKAASYANGKYIKYLDSDDIIYPHGLEVMVNAMEKFPEASIGLSFNNYKDNVQLPICLNSKNALKKHFFETGLLYIGPSGTIFKNSEFRKISKYKDYGVATDYYLNLKLALENSIVLFQRDLIWWRTHEGQEINLQENNYLYQNNRILYSIIHDPQFPFNEKEKKEIEINYGKNISRKIIKQILRIRFGKAINIYKLTNPKIVFFLYALLPSRIRKIFI